jgi:hypothetical protein
MASVTMENVVGTRVLIHLQPEAFEVLDVQGIEEPSFVARVLGYDTFGLWVENTNYCVTPVYTDDGAYIPPEERGEVCHRAVVLLQWGYIQTILQFPDRPTYGATLNASEIGFKLRLPVPSVTGAAAAVAPSSAPARKPKVRPAEPAKPKTPAVPKKPGSRVTAAKTTKMKGAKRG